MFAPYILHQTLQSFSLLPHYCVAYSGGLDSHVLLHALVQLRADHPALQLRAVHINHGLSPNARAWSQHCQDVCDNLGVAFMCHNIDPQYYGGNNIEKVAREERYRIFEGVLAADETLLAAHHRDDQAETLLFRLFRGAGLQGLAAMRWQRPLGKGQLLRPLLDIPRSELEAYAKREKLNWIEDESNQLLHLDRNYLRHEILPKIQRRWLGVSAVLARAADHCREANNLLKELAQEDLSKVQGRAPQTLSLTELKKLGLLRQKNLLRFWLEALGFSPPSAKKLNQLLRDCLTSSSDAHPLITWEGVEIRRFEDNLYAMAPLAPHDSTAIIPWELGDANKSSNYPEALAGFSHWMSAEVIGLLTKIEPASFTAQKITIRFRQGGETFHPAGRVGSHPLKKLFQEWHVPPWLRNRIPLIYVDETLMMVVGYAVSQKYMTNSHGRGERVLLEFNPGL